MSVEPAGKPLRQSRLAWTALTTVLAALPLAERAASDDSSHLLALQRAASPPLGLPALAVPSRNPITAAKIALGQKLFFDARLSANGAFSCASCHEPNDAFTQTKRATPLGANRAPLPRNAPSIVNAAYMSRLMLDGESPSLETQILTPLFTSTEMGNPVIADFVRRISQLPDYAGRFEAAFGATATIGTIGAAIASYERTLLSANSPFDRWRFGGESGAVSETAKRGYALFTGKAGCAACHKIDESSALFTDQQFHDTGISARAQANGAPDAEVDAGRQSVTHDAADHFKFRTPPLRNVARTAPYMHNGSLQSLEAVVQFYNAGGFPSAGVDPRIRPLNLSDAEVAALVAFLQSLTGHNLDELAREAERREGR